jgi:hypothetical protein
MKTNNQMDDLAQKIALLKNKQDYDFELLKTHFHYAYEGLKPINMIKKTLHDVVSSSEIKADLLKVVVNYFSNAIFLEKNNPITKAIDFVIYYFVNIKSKIKKRPAKPAF